MNTQTQEQKVFPNFDTAQTKSLLGYSALIAALRSAIFDYEAGKIISPTRLVMPLNKAGVMLSMPAVAEDLAIHKLVTINPENRAQGLPTLHGQVVAWDAQTGAPCFGLDGPTLSARRTAAISMLGIHFLCANAPKDVLLIGLGKQAANHVEALVDQFPNIRIWVMGRDLDSALSFCQAFVDYSCELIACDKVPDRVEVVITTTTSPTPIYREEARADRLIVAVGAFEPTAAEIAAHVVHGSTLFVDDLAGARHEAGDYLQAGVDWAQVYSLAEASRMKLDHSHPKIFKSVGCAAWDLAACRVVKLALANKN